MNKLTQLFLSLMLIALSGCWGGEPLQDLYEVPAFTTGKGNVEYKAYLPLKDKPIQIHYYIPTGNVATMPILFVFPGVNRNANDYLNAWTSIAEQKKVMVFSLEFPSGYYSSEEYIEGGMFRNQVLKPEAEWSFSLIEPLFAYIRKELNGTQAVYDLWGHSAGAQFVHRYMMFKTDAPVRMAVSANAGWYTVPDLQVEYPYGLKNSPSDATKLERTFAHNLVLMLGTADTDPNDPNLNHTPGAELQGAHRYARGLYFWHQSIEISTQFGHFNWTKQEVAGVAHDYVRMAAHSVEVLYGVR